MRATAKPIKDATEATLQLDAKGNLRHLLTLKGLDKALLIDILDDAEGYLTKPGSQPARSRSLAGRTVAIEEREGELQRVEVSEGALHELLAAHVPVPVPSAREGGKKRKIEKKKLPPV